MPAPDSIRSWPPARRWWYALKPASWGKLIVPAALGLCLGLGAGNGEVNYAAIPWGLAYTFALLAFVVLLNDWGDRGVDVIKRRMFPDGCSPKTIPDRILPARAVLFVGLAAGAGCIALGVIGELWLDRPFLGAASALALSVFVAYSLPPVHLNYRGGGELLEALGVGLVLPSLMMFAVAGRPSLDDVEHALLVLPGWTMAALASAVASGLADEVSDREGGKRTFVTELGNDTARRLVEASLALAALWWLLAGTVGARIVTVGWAGILALLAAGAWTIVLGGQLVQRSDAATSVAFGAIANYKLVLHRAVRGAGWILALLCGVVDRM